MDKQYRDALGDYGVMPREAQWQRLEAALRREKKRRFLWWWWRGVLGFLVVGLVAGSVYWYSGKQALNPAAIMDKKAVVLQDGASPEAQHKNDLLSGQTGERQPALPEIANAEARTNAAEKMTAPRSVHRPAAGTGRYSGIRLPVQPQPNVVPANPTPVNPAPVNPVPVNAAPADPEWLLANLSRRHIALLALAPPRIQAALIVNWVSGVPVIGKQPTTPDPDGGFFLAAAWAGGHVDNPISFIENPSKQHKDQAALFDQLLGSYRSNAWQLGLEYRPKKLPRFSVTGAVQYRELTKDVNFDYVYRDFPIRDADGNITGYLRDSSGPGITFNIQQRTGVRFVGFPLYLQYAVLKAGGNELAVGGGPMLQMAVGAEGLYYDATSLRVRKLDSNAFNAFSLGYQVGVAYTRHIWKPLYFSAEARYVRNPQELRMDGGRIESKLQGVQLQLGLKMRLGRQ